MKLHLATLPDDVQGQARWLEQHLLGLDLAGIVTELRALGGRTNDTPPSLEGALAGELPMVLEHGLAMLSPVRLRELLRSPELLLLLQTRIFLEGGEYWSQLPNPPEEIQATVERGRVSLRRFLEAPAVREASASALPIASTVPQEALPAGRSGVSLVRGGEHEAVRGDRRGMLARAGLLTAAALLLGVFLLKPRSPEAPIAAGWGWSRPEVLNASMSREAYLESLATAANDWFKRRPATSEALSERLEEFRRGCTTLISAEHRSLPEADRVWLVERCRAWLAKIDQHIADVNSGEEVLTVRERADATVEKLIQALKTRATSEA